MERRSRVATSSIVRVRVVSFGSVVTRGAPASTSMKWPNHEPAASPARAIAFGSVVAESTVPRSAAAVASGEDLAGIQEPARVEHALQILLERDELGGLLEREVGGLEDADPVLAGEGAAE